MNTHHPVDVAAVSEQFPLITRLQNLEELSWFNPEATSRTAEEGLAAVGLSESDVRDAADRLKRFAPYLAEVFPDATRTYGILESPLVGVPALQASLEQPGQLWAKLDSHLPISGSIKARGGIYEVLAHAEKIALEAGLITVDSDYRELGSEQARELFSRHKVAVGSTGNLGLSIGIMSATLGFQASVHMSADARQWKKDKLREHGVNVVEYESDYSVAVEQGRAEAEGDPLTHFVDDENSVTLFLGYAVAGARFAGQLAAYDVRPTVERPMFVYLPCGVGGGPGGVAFGLKAALGDAVRCIFVEPTHSPAMLLGVHTGLHDAVSVQDFGIDNLTAADGLAVGRPSGFVGQRMEKLLDGYLTVDDDNLYRLISLLDETEGIRIEPSAAAGLIGPARVAGDADYLARLGLDAESLEQCTHVAWVTGGSMVPAPEMASYLDTGARLRENAR
ncbi:D-serine ammonia-lyase [Corynebacterium guangdongense]|uniref:Probable D-serine dehydratase n=1 Tax=Corynebacterium guangdongense TaxID=1783348 RepID=A0ABU1ZWA9_9CORY|nr:D-serine ammonia-lyase [Corynebacterium guangdongense]MDR7329190.1 D-serine dehydratase [Corynebacterium guangdongense]WJZ17756.1 D-serine dehydratase [Corynebacterium guangdongense]